MLSFRKQNEKVLKYVKKQQSEYILVLIFMI